MTATIAGLTIADGKSDSNGGGIDNAGTLTVTNCTLSGNSAPQGGGILSEPGGTLTVTNSTLSGNSADYFGGGILNYEGTLTVTNSTLSGNSAGEGGGIDNAGGLWVANSTLSRNSAQFGGGIENGGTLTVTDSTLSGNSASSEGGGIDLVGATLTLANTIVAGNSAPTGPDVDGTVASLGYNLIGNSSGGSGFAASDLLGVSPLLGPLQNNGGPTQTMALLPGSPAIDAGSNYLVPSGITTDQRGDPRDVNGV